MALTVFDRVRQLYHYQMWNSLAEFSSLFAGVVSAAVSSDSSATTTSDLFPDLGSSPPISSSASTSSSSAATAVVSLPAKQKMALQVMVAHALIENKEFARAEALLKDALQHRKPEFSDECQNARVRVRGSTVQAQF